MTTPRTACALAVASLSVLLMTGCGSGGQDAAPSPIPSQTQSASPTPGDGQFVTPEAADRSDVESTAETAALMLHSWDTATDESETTAAKRAAPLMSQEWASHQVAPERNASQGEWLEPAKHEAYSAPILSESRSDATAHDYGPNRAERQYEVTWTWQGRDGTAIPSSTARKVTIFLERHDGQWEVVGHDSRPLPGHSQIDQDS